MRNVNIYRPSKNVMQSGRANASDWVIEYKTNTILEVEPVMGWTSSNDTLSQVRLKFSSCEMAVSFANKNNWNYILIAENERRIKPRNYSDNFKYVQVD